MQTAHLLGGQIGTIVPTKIQREIKMTYYERVKLFRDNQQRLLDEFLAEVVLSGLITKKELKYR